MKSPRLDRRITIQTPDNSRASDGSAVSTWVDLAEVCAGKKDVPSMRRGEPFASAQHNDAIFTEWTIRYLPGLTGAERIVDDAGNFLNVVGIPQELGRREYLVIITERGVVK